MGLLQRGLEGLSGTTTDRFRKPGTQRATRREIHAVQCGTDQGIATSEIGIGVEHVENRQAAELAEVGTGEARPRLQDVFGVRAISDENDEAMEPVLR